MYYQYFYGGQVHVIWKKSQYLGLWSQRLLRMIDPITLTTAKQQSIDQITYTFRINCEQVTKLTLYDRTDIKGEMMGVLKVEHTRETLMADKAYLMMHLFAIIVRGKLIVEKKESYLKKENITGMDLHTGKQYKTQFRVFRQIGTIQKQFKLQQMCITQTQIDCYHKIGVGTEKTAPDWSVSINSLKKMYTKFQFFNNNLIIKIFYTLGSCRFAVPVHGSQIFDIMKCICHVNSQMMESQGGHKQAEWSY